jgi:phosphopantothenoylcysteine decarboxylase / phosphopantothenate---cysteine ligase
MSGSAMPSANKKRKTILITAGPTVEDIDPVRFISNRATGKLGIATAHAALKAGHKVILIHGPIREELTAPLARARNIQRVPVRSAAQMLSAVMRHVKRADVVIMNAAVADYTPAQQSGVKLKKAGASLVIRLKPTVDILKTLGRLKTRRPELKLIGFALETGHGKTAVERKASQRSEAFRKLREKNLDAIILDTPHAMGASSSQFNLIDRDGNSRTFKLSKTALAKILVSLAISL